MNGELTWADEFHMDQVRIKQAAICWWSLKIPATAPNITMSSILKFQASQKNQSEQRRNCELTLQMNDLMLGSCGNQMGWWWWS